MFLARQDQAATLCWNLDAEVAARNVAFKAEVRRIRVAVAAGIGITRLRGGGKISDSARLTALGTAVRDDGYPDGSKEV